MRTLHVIAVSVLCLCGLVGAIVPAIQGETPSSQVTRMKLPLDLPAIGNIDAVKTWRFGRIEEVIQSGAGDVGIKIRTADGRVHQVVGPRVLRDLAQASNWMRPETNNPRVTRADYVERMVAFDVDESGRIIAMISLEPMDRDAERLKRGL